MAKQFSIPTGRLLTTLLIGRDPESGSTWLQFEYADFAPLTAPAESLRHAFAYLQYKLTDRQIGPLGVSVRTDARPLHLRLRLSC
jgi:hypothetical protein